MWSLATQWLICLSLATLWSLCSILSLCLCIQSPFFVEGQPRVWELVKTTNTIESSSQPGLLNSSLPNYAECRTEDRSGDLLVQMAAQANALMNLFGPIHAQQIVCARCGQKEWEICRRGSKKTARKSVVANSIDEELKKEESARQLVQNDSATMKIQRFSWAVGVPHAVRPTRPLERMQAEPARDHHQALLHVLMISGIQRMWPRLPKMQSGRTHK